MARRHVRGEPPKPGEPQVLHKGPSTDSDTLDRELPPGFREVIRVGISADGQVAVGLRLRLPVGGERQDPHLWGQVLFRAAQSIAHAAGSGGGTMQTSRGMVPVPESVVLSAIMAGVMDSYEEVLPKDDEGDDDE